MELLCQDVKFDIWEKYDEEHTVVRFATSFATRPEDIRELRDILERGKEIVISVVK